MNSGLRTLVFTLMSLVVLGAITLGIAACVVARSWDSGGGLFGECPYGDWSSECDPASSSAATGDDSGLADALRLHSTVNRKTSKRCVVATVTDAVGDRVADETVRFSVPAAPGQARPRKGSELTDELGQASFCYTPSPPFVIRKIRVFVDTDDNGRRDEGEPSELVPLWE